MLDEVFVMGKTVLYVHIPDRINISQHLQQYVRLSADLVELTSHCCLITVAAAAVVVDFV